MPVTTAHRAQIADIHPQAKMTDTQIAQARQLRDQGEKLSVIAARFGVSDSYMSRLCRGERR